jgi:integrase/recombinase XerD
LPCGLLCADAHARCPPNRINPTQTAEALATLVRERRLDPDSTDTLFRNSRGSPLTRFGVRYLLRKYVERARASAPTLKAKRVHPHTVRHTTAVHLLQAGVDLRIPAQGGQ